MSKKKTAIVRKETRIERYAVIEGASNGAFSERFVIAYRNEESLRELITAPGIVGVGLRSCEAAVAGIPDRLSQGINSENIPERLVFRRDDYRRAPQSLSQRVQPRVGLEDIRRMACATLQHAIAGGVVMFYSRSILGVAIRAFVGA